MSKSQWLAESSKSDPEQMGGATGAFSFVSVFIALRAHSFQNLFMEYAGSWLFRYAESISASCWSYIIELRSLSQQTHNVVTTLLQRCDVAATL